jgi:hypothetical protein
MTGLFSLSNHILKTQDWWYTPIIPALWRLRQVYPEFEASLGNT